MSETTQKRRATAEDAGRTSAPDPQVVMDYVSDMCRELALMARRAGNERLAGLLDLAQHEASGGQHH